MKTDIFFVPDTISEKELVRKTNTFIQAHYSEPLTAKQMDLLNILFSLSNINKANEIEPVNIKMVDLINFWGLENSNSAVERIKEIIIGLMQKTFELFNQDTKDFKVYNIVGTSSYDNKTGICTFEFNHKLKPFLFDLRQYTWLIHRHTIKLNSFNTKRIYELVMQYQNLGKKDGTWQRKIKIDELKKFLGISKKEYALYGHFKSRILNPAIEDIEKNTNIIIYLEESKLCRKVDEITFYVEIKEDYKATFLSSHNEKEVTETEVIEHKPVKTTLLEQKEEKITVTEKKEIQITLEELGIKPKIAEELANNFNEKYISFAISKCKNAKNVEDLAPYLVTFIKNKFDFDKFNEVTEKEKKRTQKFADEEKAKQTKKDIEKQIKDIEEKYQTYFEQTVIKYEQLMGKERLKEAVFKSEVLFNNSFIERFEKNGILDRFIRTAIIKFLKMRLTDFLNPEEFYQETAPEYFELKNKISY